MSASAPPAAAPGGSQPPAPPPSSSQTGQASAGASGSAVTHWSKVHLGCEFTCTVDGLGARKDKSVTVLLRRNAVEGYSESMEPGWQFKPDNKHADSEYMVKQNLRGQKGKEFVAGRLSGKRVQQAALGFFKAAPSPPKPAQPAPPEPQEAASPAPPVEPEKEQVPGGIFSPPAAGLREPARNMEVEQEVETVEAAAAAARAAEAAVPIIQVCGGVSLIALLADKGMEPLGRPFVQHYPFAYHAETTSWSLPSYEGVVWSRECFARGCLLLPPSDPADAVEGPCPSCSVLTSNNTLIELLQRATSPDTMMANFNDRYLSHKQLCDKYRAKSAKWQLQRVKFWHQRDRIKKLAAPIEAAKQIFVLLSRNNLARVREFMSCMIARGASPKMMLLQLGKAIAGEYKPRSDAALGAAADRGLRQRAHGGDGAQAPALHHVVGRQGACLDRFDQSRPFRAGREAPLREGHLPLDAGRRRAGASATHQPERLVRRAAAH
eukprot:4992561-Prymnesium_polylepis.1